jgi:hypothetical protein
MVFSQGALSQTLAEAAAIVKNATARIIYATFFIEHSSNHTTTIRIFKICLISIAGKGKIERHFSIV